MKITNDSPLHDYKSSSDEIIDNKSIINDGKLNNENSNPLNKGVGVKVDSVLIIFKNNLKPILAEPEIRKPDIKQIIKSLEVDNDNDIYDNKKTESSGMFNFLSSDMIKLINLIVKYLEAMITKFEASREIGVMLMNIELNMADQIKDNLHKKANIMIGAAITSAGISMVVHGMGAFVSIKGMGKDLIGHSNPTMITGNLITSTADPLARVADQTLQSKGIVLDGEQKVLEARSSINNHVISNNNEVQRDVTEVIKALLQAIEAIIHAQQDAASAIGSNVRG